MWPPTPSALSHCALAPGQERWPIAQSWSQECDISVCDCQCNRREVTVQWDLDQENNVTTLTIMYRVQGTMRENYYGEEEMPRKSNLVSIFPLFSNYLVKVMTYFQFHQLFLEVIPTVHESG